MKKILILLTLILAGCGQKQALFNPHSQHYALTGANVVDVLNRQVLANTTVEIEDDKIVAIYPDDTSVLNPDIEQFDVQGRYLIPGLIDAHVHLLMRPADEGLVEGRLSNALAGGVTGVRDMAGNAQMLRGLTRWPDSPEIYYSALIAGPEFFSDPRTAYSSQPYQPGKAPWMQGVDEQSDIAQVIENAKSTGATGIKLYANLAPGLVKKLTAQAHKAGLSVWSHSSIFPSKPSDAVNAGVDVLSHISLFTWEAEKTAKLHYHDKPVFPVNPRPAQNVKLTSLFAVMAKKDTMLDTTLTINRMLEQRAANTSPGAFKVVNWACQAAIAANENGVKLVLGTDRMGAEQPGQLPNIHGEMALLVNECGLPPMVALQGATIHGAKTVGRADEVGSISVGKRANIVVLEGDPTKDIANTRAIAAVIKDGRLAGIELTGSN